VFTGIPRQLAIIRVITCIVMGLIGGMGRASADQVDLGIISFDNLIPPDPNGTPGTNGFNIFNFTGAFDLPPEFTAAEDVTFGQSSLALVGMLADSTPFTPTINLGDIGPGPLQGPDGFPPSSLQFPDTTTFSRAEFQATLGPLTFSLADGSVFTADSSKIDVLLLPSQGNNNLIAGDTAVISVSGTISAPSVPEPASWSLLLLAMPWVGLRLWQRQKQDTGPAA
jgi:hypothetical protein